MQPKISRALLSLITCAVALSSATLQAAKPHKWAVVNEQVGPIPLPFQAAIVRRSHRNLGKHEIEAEYPYCGVIPLFRRPGDADFRELGALDGRIHGLVSGNKEVPLSLRPGFQASIVVRVGLRYHRRWEPVFTEPGTYTLQFYSGEQLEILVDKPRGADKVICNLLRTNPSLAEAVHSYHEIPEEDLVTPLRRIVNLNPKSSYADYARYALARWYTWREYNWSAPKIPVEDRQRVAALLSSIDERFAYAPHALILRFHVLQSMHSPEADEVLATLEQVHFDSSEYLDFLSGRLNQDEWNLRNPRAPRRIPVIEAKRTPAR